MYRDELGLIVQKNGDGGDTLQRTGFYYLPGLIRGDKGAQRCYDHETTLLFRQGQGLTRHIKQYPEQKDVSRDQLTPNIVALGFYSYAPLLKITFLNLVKNFFRYPNNSDIASPEHLCQFLRSFMKMDKAYLLFYPLLFIGDLFMLIGVIIRCVQAKYKLTFEKWYKPRIIIDRDNVGDDLNTLVSVVQAQYTFPTPISWIARKVYRKFRPQPFVTPQDSCILSMDGQPPWKNHIYLALLWYFRPETGANYEIAVAWKEICDNL